MISNSYTVFIEDISGNQIKYQLKDWHKALQILNNCSREKPYKQAVIKENDRIVISLRIL